MPFAGDCVLLDGFEVTDYGYLTWLQYSLFSGDPSVPFLHQRQCAVAIYDLREVRPVKYSMRQGLLFGEIAGLGVPSISSARERTALAIHLSTRIHRLVRTLDNTELVAS